jgi:hypothetical protein
MNSQLVAEWLKSLSLTDRAKALNLISFRLTIHARDYFLAATGEAKAADVQQLRGINELHHKLLSQAGHYLDGEETAVYPVDVFSRILNETAHHYA